MNLTIINPKNIDPNLFELAYTRFFRNGKDSLRLKEIKPLKLYRQPKTGCTVAVYKDYITVFKDGLCQDSFHLGLGKSLADVRKHGNLHKIDVSKSNINFVIVSKEEGYYSFS